MAKMSAALTLHDIPWLRQCSRKDGGVAVPSGVATKLLAGGLIERDQSRACLTITNKGKLALTRLG